MFHLAEIVSVRGDVALRPILVHLVPGGVEAGLVARQGDTILEDSSGVPWVYPWEKSYQSVQLRLGPKILLWMYYDVNSN